MRHRLGISRRLRARTSFGAWGRCCAGVLSLAMVAGCVGPGPISGPMTTEPTTVHRINGEPQPLSSSPPAESQPVETDNAREDRVQQASYIEVAEQAAPVPATDDLLPPLPTPMREPSGPLSPVPERSMPSDAPPMAGVMGLMEVESLAAQYNPSLVQAAAVVQKARGTHYQLGLWPNPTIGYSGDEIGDDGTYGQQGFYVSQMIVLGGKLAAGQCVADQEIQSTLWQAETQRYRVRNDVRRLYYETLGAQERVRLTRELEEIARQGVSNALALKEALQAAQPDVLQAEIQAQGVQILLRNAEYQHRAAWLRLASAIGLPELALVELQNTLEAQQPPRDRDVAWMQLEAQSPQLQQAAVEVQRARALICREQLQPIPNLMVQLGVMQMAVSDNTAASVQVGVPLPLFNKNEGNISRAMAESQRACANYERLRLSLQSGLAEAYREYQDALNRVALYRDEIVPREQQTLDLIQAAYPIQFDFLRLLTARRSYFEARLNHLEALVDLRQAEVTLDGLLLTGALDPVPDTDLDDALRGQALSNQ
jgi:cobalt-zinc-cadmium efflux system outer membrane protein